MFSPIRLWFAIRRDEDFGLLAAAAVVAVLFAATPFLIPEVAEEFDITLGTAGLYSTVQVGGFALAAFYAGRRLSTSRRLFVGAAVAGVFANGMSTLATDLWPLFVFRFVAGAAAGLITWLAWARGMRSAGAIRRVAVIGPLGAFVGAPIAAWLVSRYGLDAMFMTLTIAHAPIVFLRVDFAGLRQQRTEMSPSRSNVVLLAAIGLMVMSASALFVQAAALGEQVLGMDPIVVSLGFSANALAGLAAASRPAPTTVTAWPVVAIALCVAGVAWAGAGWVWFLAIALWGGFFWLTVPRALRAVALWSLVPEERVGDAQSIMAAGRAVGPALGGLVLGADRFAALGVFSVSGVLAAAVVVESVRRYRLANDPPAGAIGF